MAGPTKPSEGETRMARANVLTQTTNQILNEGFKGLVLLNGGGAAAMAAFLQAIWDKPSAAPMRIYLLCGIGLLLLGAAVASILFLVRYRSFFDPNTNTPPLNPWWRWMHRLIAVSLGCFLVGMALVVIGGLKSL
jgi:cation transporter-like permease